MEAQEIFGLDFDPSEFEQVARDGVASDEEELDEEVCMYPCQQQHLHHMMATT